MSEWVWACAATLRPGLMVLSGEIGTAGTHAHHTVQIMLARRGEFVLADGRGARRRTHAVIVPPDRAHAVVEGAPDGMLVHVDPESGAGRRLTEIFSESDDIARWCAAGAAIADDSEWFQDGRFRAVVAAAPAPHRHPAVTRALALLPGRLDAGPLRLADLARDVELSESRLAHLFSADVGLPFRPYVRWLRLQRATELVAAGNTLTAAAHGAGFADSSHLNRVCHRTFGSAPSELNRIRWVDDLIM
ncbi:helix-turn-helix transcriptional regulator [Nocardia uniformis]|uniref:Helix-turn-helix transcriptional regulator n=1 Tax=Nocardia uniformis TaxID=53432 RepID=A0A849CBS4_9NOCA|nr:helix-turn-helix transcriptional regulator [Nocardia uniformis]NNH70411.1 helix-turn-helix transcriptional regulator [Nocardia uniformis]